MSPTPSKADLIEAKYLAYIEKFYKDDPGRLKGATFGTSRSIPTKTGICKHCQGEFGYKTTHPALCPTCHDDPAIAALFHKPGHKGPRMR